MNETSCQPKFTTFCNSIGDFLSFFCGHASFVLVSKIRLRGTFSVGIIQLINGMIRLINGIIPLINGIIRLLNGMN